MRSVIPMRIAKIGYMAVSLVMCLLGVWLIVDPALSISLLGTVFGMVLIVFGVIRLIGYFSRDLFRLAFQYDLAVGVLMILLGILMLVNPGSILNFICITLGISVLIDSVFKIQIAIDAKKFGVHKWWLIFGLAILAGVFGSVLMFRPFVGSYALMALLGVTLLSGGILNFSTVLTTVKIIRHQRPDTIEVDRGNHEDREDREDRENREDCERREE